jgi:hypothetical protein
MLLARLEQISDGGFQQFQIAAPETNLPATVTTVMSGSICLVSNGIAY